MNKLNNAYITLKVMSCHWGPFNWLLDHLWDRLDLIRLNFLSPTGERCVMEYTNLVIRFQNLSLCVRCWITLIYWLTRPSALEWGTNLILTYIINISLKCDMVTSKLFKCLSVYARIMKIKIFCLIWTCPLSGLIEVCIRNGVVIWDFKTPVGEKISKMKIKIN